MSEARSPEPDLPTVKRQDPQPVNPKRFAAAKLTGPTLFVVLFLAIVGTSPHYGVSWDEPYYFLSQERQRSWFAQLVADPAQALTQESLDVGWNDFVYHNPHPPFYKLAANATAAIASPPLSPLQGFRLAPALFFAATGWMLFGLVARLRGHGEALAATLLWASIPRVFGHGHFAATDTPMAFFAVATLSLFVRSLKHPKFAWALGALFGTALATKFTAVLLPAPWLAWVALRRDPAALRTLIIAGIVALPVAVLWNPGWWADPVGAIFEFVTTSSTRSQHTPIRVLHWGTVHDFSAPWSQPLVLLAVAVPLTITAPAAIGLAATLRRIRLEPEWALLAVAAVVPIAIVMLPISPNHDGVRLFLAAFPFLAALAARGGTSVARWIAQALSARTSSPWKQRSRAFGCVLAAFALAAQATAVIQTHPFPLSYYNVMIGGLKGAHAKGLETTYWMEALTPAALDAIQQELPHGARVNLFVGDPYYFKWLQEQGRVREDLHFEKDPNTRYQLVVFRTSALGTKRARALLDPDFDSAVRYEVALEGVPLVRLYELPVSP